MKAIHSTEAFKLLKKAWGLPDEATRIEIVLAVGDIVRVKCEYIAGVDAEDIQRLAEDFELHKVDE